MLFSRFSGERNRGLFYSNPLIPLEAFCISRSSINCIMIKLIPPFILGIISTLVLFLSACNSKQKDVEISQEIPQEIPQEPMLPLAAMEQLRALGYAGGTHEKPALRQHDAMYAPNHGNKAVSHQWVPNDLPVQNLLSSIPTLQDVEIGGQTRNALPIRSGNAWIFKGKIKENAALYYGVGQTYAQIRPISLILQLDILDSQSNPIQQEIVSSVAGAWIDRTVNLSSYAGRTLQLVFSVLSLDPSQDQNSIYLCPLLVTSPARGSEKSPHVFFILVDTLRADALGCYEQKDPVSPNLDQLAREGLLAENMIAQSPHTETSIPSILLGLYPHIHGRMLRFSRHNTADPIYVKKNALSNQSLSIAEIFQQAGYWTTGFYNNLLISSQYGFNRGLYEYTDYAAEHGMSDPWGRIALPTAQLGVQETIRYLEQAPWDIPLFVFLHILDPHNPYTPPGNFNLSVHKPASKIDEAAYLGEVAYVDEQIGKLLTFLKQTGLYQNSIILVASDHGEEFVNDWGRPIGHGRTLFQTQLHVPFLCVYPSKIPAGSRIAQTLETVDIFPTLLELAGLETKQTISGESFASLLTASQSHYTKTDAVAEGIRRGEERKCLIQNPFKLVYFRDSDRTFLYNIQSDPNELQDIAKDHPDIVQSMKQHLFERLDMKEPVVHPLQVVALGQDGWDLVHTFDKDSSYWLPGVADMHMQIQPLPDLVSHVEIWADDHLHGNHNYAMGWRYPPLGEYPVVIEKKGEMADLFFEQTESLIGSRLFVRLLDDQEQVYLGSVEGQDAEGTSRNVQTRYPALMKWDFEDSNAIKQWRTGEGGALTIRKMGSESILQFETNARSGSYRAYNIIPKIPSGRRLCISMQIRIESGGIRMELIHPKSASVIAAHAFSTEQSTEHVTRIEAKKMVVCGITGVSQHDEELLFLLSNYSPQNSPAHVFLNDITAYLYPEELETSTSSMEDGNGIDPSF